MATAAQPGARSKTSQNNLSVDEADSTESDYLPASLMSFQGMKDGAFSVRLPGFWTGLAGKIADHFNEIVSANPETCSAGERKAARKDDGFSRTHRLMVAAST